MANSLNSNACAFHIFHPALPIAFFLLWIIFTMVAFHPVYLLISFAAAITLSFLYFGVRKTFNSLRWQLPLVALIALVNPLFSAQGSTEICKIGALTIYAEALLFGAFMGLMLITMLACFSCASKAITHEGFMSVSAGRLPVVAFMISMTARLVPSLKRKAREIGDVQAACTSAQGGGVAGVQSRKDVAGVARNGGTPKKTAFKKSELASRKKFNMRLFTVLMGWSMEDSLAMADSMKIAGWGATQHRTTYSLYKIKQRDVLMLSFIGMLFALNVAFALTNCANFSFYPTVTPINFSFGYIDYAVFAFLPVILELIENV